MRTYTILLAALSSLASAAPARRAVELSNFFLVTTTQLASSSNSSLLHKVSAISLFHPFDQQTYLLRTIQPGYNTLPTFTLLNGNLLTKTEKPHGLGEAVYNSTGPLTAGDELGFLPSVQSTGNLALKDGSLLTVDGQAEGWTICSGPLEESVVRT